MLNTPNVVSNRHNLGSGYFLLLNGKQYQEMCRLNMVSNYEQQGWCYGYHPYFKTSKTRRLCRVVFIPMYDVHISLSAVVVLLTLTLRILAYKWVILFCMVVLNKATAECDTLTFFPPTFLLDVKLNKNTVVSSYSITNQNPLFQQQS
jgi:hypothetical protein